MTMISLGETMIKGKPLLARFQVMDKLRKLAALVVPPLVTIAVLLLVWQVLCGGEGSSLPAPLKVYHDAKDLILHPFFDNGGTDVGLFWQILASLKRVAIGFSLASVCGIALGVLVGQSSFAHRGLDPIFQVLRTVPPLAWLPISLAAFKDTNPSAIFVIYITAIWPIILNTAVGVRQIPQDYRNIARVLQLNGFEYFFKIMLPATVPYMFTGLRIGIGLSWLAIVAAEMLVGGVGIGFFIWDGWNSSLLSEIILALIYVGIVGFMLDRLIGFLGRLIAGRPI
jgi:nitrate/nitrite transport system permease protein